MSTGQKMTDEAVTRAVATVLDDVSHHGAVDAVQALGVECERARSGEARLLEENGQKEETIKALADVLESFKNKLVTNYQSAPGYHEITINNWERARMLDALEKAGRKL